MLRVIAIVAAASALAVMATGALADQWEWPSQMSFAGLAVSRIQGSVRSDGSGSATGSMQIPGVGAVNVSLNRSSRGDVSGSGSLSSRLGSADVQGNFSFTNGGLNGDGRARLGSLTVPVTLSAGGGSISYSGSTPVDAQVDTPLAVYRFSGTLNVDGNSSRTSVSARGQVKRTGKLANQATTQDFASVPVGSDGYGTANVGGVSVRFKFF